MAVPRMAKAAESQELAAAFEKHEVETRVQVERLEQIFALIAETPRGKNCPAIFGDRDEVDQAGLVCPFGKQTPSLTTSSTSSR